MTIRRDKDGLLVARCDVCGREKDTGKKAPYLAASFLMQQCGWMITRDQKKKKWEHKCKICTKFI